MKYIIRIDDLTLRIDLIAIFICYKDTLTFSLDVKKNQFIGVVQTIEDENLEFW